MPIVSLVSTSGSIELDNSILTTDLLIFDTKLTSLDSCLSTSGYCYYSMSAFQNKEILENKDWLNFENSDLHTIDSLNTKFGKGYIYGSMGGGGRVVLGAKQIYLKNNSIISSNGAIADSLISETTKDFDKNDEHGVQTKHVIAGTGGFVYLLCENLNLEDMPFNSIQAIGNEFVEDETKVFTSSSGGSVYVKYKTLSVKKNSKKVNRPNVENYVFVNIKKDLFSSSGIVYINAAEKKRFSFKQSDKSESVKYLDALACKSLK